MNTSLTASLVALRAADPAADVDVRPLVPEWDAIATRFEAGSPAPRRRLSPWSWLRVGRGWRLAALGAFIVAAAVTASVIARPWSSGEPGSIAYGVTLRSNGIVTVRISVDHPMAPAKLEAQLRLIGVPALVLTQSSQCSEPTPVSVRPNGRLISYPSALSRLEGFAINPTAIPSGAVLLVELPPSSVRGAASYAGLILTDNSPTCVGPPAGESTTPISTGSGG